MAKKKSKAKKKETSKKEESKVSAHLKALRNEAEKRGIGNVENFNEDQLETMIQAVDDARSKEAKEEETNMQDKEGEQRWRTKREKMKKHLEEQPKIDFFVPTQPGEKPGMKDFVQINGYKVPYIKGEVNRLPKQAAEILADSLSIPMTVGEDLKVDRDKSTQEALS